MMARLTLDIRDHGPLVRRADAERGVPLLPIKARAILIEPARAIAFQILNCLGQRRGCRQGNEHVDVVVSPASNDEGNLLLSRYASKISPQRWWIRDCGGSVLRAENAAHQVRDHGVRHGNNLSVSKARFRDDGHKPMCRPRGTPDSNQRLPSAEALGFLMMSREAGRRGEEWPGADVAADV